MKLETHQLEAFELNKTGSIITAGLLATGVITVFVKSKELIKKTSNKLQLKEKVEKIKTKFHSK